MTGQNTENERPQPLRNLYRDDPLDDLTTDQLDRSSLVSAVRAALDRVVNQGTSTVFSVVGPWGSGKTTLLNAVERDLVADNSWVVVHYNPWVYSTYETAVQGFFSEIRAAIPDDQKQADIRGALGQWVGRFSPIGAAGGLFGVDATGALKVVSEALQGDQSPDGQRLKSAALLAGLTTPILVIVDDLDRLDPEELLLTFKLIRLLGRMPNLSYVLAYDERTLLDTLSRSALVGKDSSRARDYLEKIVQVRLDIPPMLQKQQLELVNDNIGALQVEYDIVLTPDDNATLQVAWNECLSLYLTQPRAIKRLFTQVDATFGAVSQEVNLAEYVLIVFLQTFERPVFDLLHERRDELLQTKFSFDRTREKPEAQWARWIELLRDRGVARPEAVGRVIAELFYSLKGASSGTSYGSDWIEIAAQRRGVGSPEFFDRYFQGHLPAGDISESLVDAAIAELRAGTLGSAVKNLRALMRTDAELVMGKLRRRHKSEALPDTPTIYLLASAYTDAMQQKSGPFGMSPDFGMLQLASELLANAPAENALTFFSAISESTDGLNLAADLVHRANQRQGESDPNWLAEARSLMSELIRTHLEATKATKLDESRRYSFRLLWSLASIMPEAELHEFVLSLIGDESAWTIEDFLASLVPLGTASDGRRQWQSMGDLAVDTIFTFFTPETLWELLGDVPSDTKHSDQDSDLDFDRRRETPTWESRTAYALAVLTKWKSTQSGAVGTSLDDNQAPSTEIEDL